MKTATISHWVCCLHGGKEKNGYDPRATMERHNDLNLGTGLTVPMIPNSALGACPSTLAHLWRIMSQSGLCKRRSDDIPLVERGSKKRRCKGEARNKRHP